MSLNQLLNDLNNADAFIEKLKGLDVPEFNNETKAKMAMMEEEVSKINQSLNLAETSIVKSTEHTLKSLSNY